MELQHYREAKALMGITMPVARRVLGEPHELTLKMRCNYARALVLCDGETPDNIREAMKTLEEAERIARRLLGSAHPLTVEIDYTLRRIEALDARESPPQGGCK
jgi:hypothetical protein